MPYRVTLFDWFLLSCLVVLWGSSFVMSKIALQEIHPAWIAASRLVIGSAILLPFGLWRDGWPQWNMGTLRQFSWLGFVGNTAPFLIITWGIQFISSGVAGLLMGTIPLIMIVFAHYFLPNEKLTPRRSFGFALGFLGIVVLMGPSALEAIKFTGNALVGELAIVLGCLFYGVNSISAKRMNIKGSITNSAGVLGAGAIMAVIAAYFIAPFDLDEKSSNALWAVFGLGLFPTGIATTIWFKGLERTSPTFISMSNYLVPIYALVFGAILLNEKIDISVLAALVLVLAGIYVSRSKPQPSQ